MSKKAKLSAKQRAFVNEYLKTRNATQSYLKVYGGSEKAARANGARLIANDNVAAALEAAGEKAAEKVGVSVEWIVESAQEVAQRCMQKVPVMVRDPEDGRKWIQEVDEETGEGVWKFDAKGAVSALTLLSKHTGGFSDRVTHDISAKLEDLLTMSRE